MSSSPQPILQVSHLHVAFSCQERQQQVVADADFTIFPGEMLALVGESGSGKSLTALALLGLLPPPHARISAGSILFQGHSLSGQSEDAWRQLRGNRLAMIFQEPMTALNPVLTIRTQLAEVLQHHLKLQGQSLRQRCQELLLQVNIPEPERCLGAYPHQLSGGMRQRVMIAMALACKPKLLIADEPTTALDVTVQAQIMTLLDTLRRDCGTAILFITHNMALVSQYADRCAVMYAGQIVEYADNRALFAAPTHPYTRLLLRAMPQSSVRGQQLAAIPGVPPPANAMPAGCRFGSRCPFFQPRCSQLMPPRTAITAQHWVSCHRLAESLPLPPPPLLPPAATAAAAMTTGPLLQVRNLQVEFQRRRHGKVRAVDGIDFSLNPGETLALVGESGCGKTSAGKALLGLCPGAANGEVILHGRHDLLKLPEKDLRPLRRQIQMIFQDPFSSLNPRMTLDEILDEGMRIHGIARQSAERQLKKTELMRQVGLDPDWLGRYPHQLSGGQRQRLGLARILALQPQIILCDECTSALDVSVQAQILNLLKEIQQHTGVAYLFITHDLSVVEYLADRIAVMYLGKIVETGPAAEIFARPRHPYTRTLLAAAPRLGHPPATPPATDPALAAPVTSGCRFRPRCPQASPLCSLREPLLHPCAGDHLVSCHVAADPSTPQPKEG